MHKFKVGQTVRIKNVKTRLPEECDGVIVKVLTQESKIEDEYWYRTTTLKIGEYGIWESELELVVDANIMWNRTSDEPTFLMKG